MSLEKAGVRTNSGQRHKFETTDSEEEAGIQSPGYAKTIPAKNLKIHLEG